MLSCPHLWHCQKGLCTCQCTLVMPRCYVYLLGFDWYHKLSSKIVHAVLQQWDKQFFTQWNRHAVALAVHLNNLVTHSIWQVLCSRFSDRQTVLCLFVQEFSTVYSCRSDLHVTCITDTLLLHHNDPRCTGLLPVQVWWLYKQQVSVKAQGPTWSQPKAQDTVPIFNYNYSMLDCSSSIAKERAVALVGWVLASSTTDSDGTSDGLHCARVNN